MKRIFVAFLMMTMVILLFSACIERESAPLTTEEGIRRLAVINEEDVNWSGIWEGRSIEISNFITADEFDRIAELILAGGKMDTHGTFFGSLPSYTFGSVQVYLIPDRNMWHGETWFDDLLSGENSAIALQLTPWTTLPMP